MVYKSDLKVQTCFKLDKLGFSVSNVSFDFYKKPSCFVYLGGGSVKVEVPNDDTPIDDVVDSMERDLMDAQYDLDRMMNKRIDWEDNAYREDHCEAAA